MPAFSFDDAIVREIRDRTAQEAPLYKSALWSSGAITNDTSLAAKVTANDGRLFTSNFYRDLPDPDDGANGPTYPDDSADLVPTGTIGKSEYQVLKNGPVMSFDMMSIMRRFDFMQDPIGVISGMINQFWARYLDMTAVAQITGLIADSVANHGGDVLVNIGNATQAPDATNTIQNDTIIEAEATAGDAADFSTLVMHSRVYNNLRIQNLIDFIPSSDGKVNFSLYQGKVIIVSDKVPVATGGANPVYTTYLLGTDVFRYGSGLGAGIIGFENWRDPRTGKGAGQDQIISRIQFALHPMGYSWTDTTVTGSRSDGDDKAIYANLADQRLAVNWDRVAFDRKHLSFAAIQSNG